MFLKFITIIVIFVAICMAASSVASSISNYHISIKAMENGYVQEMVGPLSNTKIWVKKNEKENNNVR